MKAKHKVAAGLTAGTPGAAALFIGPAYMSEVESWRELPDGGIEFTMRRLPTAD